MKNWQLTTVLATTILIGASVAAGPMIEIPDPVFNFGKVGQRAKISHTFWIKSTGNDTLRITKVVPGCGCTQAPLQDSTLAPGDSTRLDLFFETRSYRGYVTKRPYLETNIDPDEKVYLKIHAHLLPKPEEDSQIVINPNPLDVSQFTELPRRKGKFLIENRSDRDYEITPIDWAEDYFTVDLPKKVKAGETAQGEITVHEERIPEAFEYSLTFQINDDQETRYTLPIKRLYRVKERAASGNSDR